MLADGAEPMDATLFEPAEEAAHGDGKGRARVGVADIGGGGARLGSIAAPEEVDEANAAASPRSATIAGTTIALPVPVRWQSVPPPRFSARPWVPRDATVLGIRSGFSFNGELHIRKHAASIEVAARFVADGDRSTPATGRDPAVTAVRRIRPQPAINSVQALRRRCHLSATHGTELQGAVRHTQQARSFLQITVVLGDRYPHRHSCRFAADVPQRCATRHQ